MASLPQLIEEDVSEINRALQDLLLKSDAIMALLIDKGGFLITQCGDYNPFDTVTLAALSAASFAATQGIAGLVNEINFSSVYQQGESYSILVLNVDEYSLLTVIFKARISAGAVKYFADTTMKEIAVQLKIAHERDPDTGLDLSMLNMANPAAVFTKKKKKAA
jgi:predicted regulator of Ras-like GTPase activity (Roadblock/LC7/MglB family)